MRLGGLRILIFCVEVLGTHVVQAADFGPRQILPAAYRVLGVDRCYSPSSDLRRPIHARPQKDGEVPPWRNLAAKPAMSGVKPPVHLRSSCHAPAGGQLLSALSLALVSAALAVSRVEALSRTGGVCSPMSPGSVRIVLGNPGPLAHQRSCMVAHVSSRPERICDLQPASLTKFLPYQPLYYCHGRSTALDVDIARRGLGERHSLVCRRAEYGKSAAHRLAKDRFINHQAERRRRIRDRRLCRLFVARAMMHARLSSASIWRG